METREGGREQCPAVLPDRATNDRVLGLHIHLDHVPHELNQRRAMEHARDRIIDVAKPGEDLAVGQPVQRQDPVVV